MTPSLLLDVRRGGGLILFDGGAARTQLAAKRYRLLFGVLCAYLSTFLHDYCSFGCIDHVYLTSTSHSGGDECFH